MTQTFICMTQKELSRYDVIKNLLDNKINGTDASKQLGISVRHVKRLKAAVSKYGAEAIVHKSRGKTSNRAFEPNTIEKIKKHLQETYYFCGPTFAKEKLEEQQGIKISKEKVRSLMTDMKLWKPKLRKASNRWHVWRARKDNFGEMEQFDGSYHKWFADEESCLLLSVDDATGSITHAKFADNESIVAVFDFWIEYFRKNGFPVSLYLDKFSTYKINHKKATDNKDMITQFQRAMKQGGVNLITAHSPEAKGRVERMFETLQDRLVKEFKLANITSKDQANEFLKDFIPKFNAKFSVVPTRKKDLHKKLRKETQEKLPSIFSIQNTRKVNNDYTVMFHNQFFQLLQKQPTTVYKKDEVIVEERLDGTIKLRLRDYYLQYMVLHEKPKKEINIKLPALTIQKQGSYKPPADHPWRRQFLFNRRKVEATECHVANA